MAVNRPPLFNVLAVALFVLAASTEPAWELTHTLTHLHSQRGHEPRAMSPAHSVRAGLTVLGDDHGHEHPVFATVLPSPGKSSAVAAALPATMFRLSVVASASPGTPAVAPNTRAGPDPTRYSHPRAPPLP